ncbi:MAG: hypothetical protein JXQ73_10480 [Phycisphaerae bacterium]|nr:hypothetical protein [Phycisphaerae bacterium]
MRVAEICYFDKPGAANTDDVMAAVNKRLKQGDVRTVVVASTTGSSALRAAELIDVPDVKICGIHFQSGQWDKMAKPDEALLAKARALGVVFIPDSPPTTFFRDIDGESADTLRKFGQGVKVATEVVLWATQTGMIDPGDLVIGVGGTGRGSDAAIVCTATTPEEIGKLAIREILCKPL